MSVGKVMSLLFNMLSRLVITFLPRSKHILISWLQSPSAVILWLSWKRIRLQWGRPGFDPRVGKILWRMERLSTEVFWPEEFHGLYSLQLSLQFSSVQFSRSVVSNSLPAHGLQHTRPPCLSPIPEAYSNSCPLSQ